LRGGKYISAAVADELVLYALDEDDQPLHKHLSDREYQVLCLIASGKEVKEISIELALSAKTISTYRARILEKMNMKTNAELTHYAIQNGLV
jgi:two-component system, NarL family, invasion response regulator UvrY